MGEIVNLHRAVKRRARAAETAAAAENRVRHGRGGAQIARDEQAASRRAALLDGARIDPPGACETRVKPVVESPTDLAAAALPRTSENFTAHGSVNAGHAATD